MMPSEVQGTPGLSGGRRGAAEGSALANAWTRSFNQVRRVVPRGRAQRGSMLGIPLIKPVSEQFRQSRFLSAVDFVQADRLRRKWTRLEP